MKVVVQRPAAPIVRGQAPSFVDTVCDVELRPLESGSGWHVLESLKSLPDENPAGLPYLHKGFLDAHAHLIWMGLHELDLDLRAAPTADAIARLVDERVRAGATVIRGYGWSEAAAGVDVETFGRSLAARLPRDVSVVLYRVCGHTAVASDRAREHAGLSEAPVLLGDRQIPALRASLPGPDAREREDAFLRAQSKLIRQGITSVTDMSLDDASVETIKGLAASGRLQIDVAGIIESGRAPTIEALGPFHVKNISAVGPWDRPATFSVRHWKRFLDGSMGARTAWLTRAYEDRDTFGEKLWESRELADATLAALEAGFLVSYHAIGDAALDQALDVGDRLNELMRRACEAPVSWASSGLHRIEHAQVVRDDQIEKLARQGFWALALQPHHRVADEPFSASALGLQRRAAWGYRAGSLLRAGLPIALSSDGPVDTESPAAVLKAVMTHPTPSENLRFSEAMWMYTTGARLALGFDPGKLTKGATVFLTQPSN